MSKLGKKISISIIVALVLVLGSIIFINGAVVERFYIWQQKKLVKEIGLIITQENVLQRENLISSLESDYDVIVLQTPLSNDLETINSIFREQANKRKISFTKLWLWDGDYERLLEQGNIVKLYNQGRLRYSILAHYRIDRNIIYIVLMNIPHVSDMVKLINFSTAIFIFIAILIIGILVAWITQRFTKSLLELDILTKDIAEGNFQTLYLQTGDEAQILSASISAMSLKLKESQERLESQNQSMKQLLSDISHEIRTPVALIDAYANGIDDGLDDGTFLNEMKYQNRRIGAMSEQLISLNKIKLTDIVAKQFLISSMLDCLCEEFSPLISRKKIVFKHNITSGLIVTAIADEIKTLLSNLIMNAIKYTCNCEVIVNLSKEQEDVVFSISNGIEESSAINIEKMWTPFYVEEHSRNKELSGYGLGLTMVREIANKNNIQIDVGLKNSTITFIAKFPNML